MEIKPIETYYNGYRFRSRLEARWAVFFDALGVKYEYEPEGFVLPDGSCYLPDFRVKCYGTRGHIGDKPFDLWIEVKGRMSSDDAKKICSFCNFEAQEADGIAYELPKNPVLIVNNIPDEGYSSDGCSISYDSMDESGVYPFNYETIDGDYFGAFPAAHDGKFYLWGDDSNYVNKEDIDAVEAAYSKARQARFEHGERG